MRDYVQLQFVTSLIIGSKNALGSSWEQYHRAYRPIVQQEIDRINGYL